jgi:hypothetical protein
MKALDKIMTDSRQDTPHRELFGLEDGGDHFDARVNELHARFAF